MLGSILFRYYQVQPCCFLFLSSLKEGIDVLKYIPQNILSTTPLLYSVCEYLYQLLMLTTPKLVCVYLLVLISRIAFTMHSTEVQNSVIC